MKQITSIIITGLVSAMLFTGCKKDDSMAAQPVYSGAKNDPATIANKTNANAGIADPDNAQVSYSIMIQPGAGGLLQWNSGNMRIGEIFFNGNVLLGNAMEKEHYSAITNSEVTLSPVSASGNVSQLGTMGMLYGSYYAPVFGIVLEGTNPPTPINPPNEALTLTGSYVRNGSNVAV